MKKILILIGVALGMLNLAYAGENYNSGYKPVVYYDNLGFNAYIDGSKVVTKWTPISKELVDEDFKYYKVLKSSTNINPVYPDDGYIHYTSEISATKYEDWKLEKGLFYYRVCAIFTTQRYCSNVVKVQINETSQEKEYKKENTEPKKEYNKEYYINTPALSEATKTKLNKIIADFTTKLNTKLESDEQRVKVIDNVMNKLRNLKLTTANQKLIQKYLIQKLETLRATYGDNVGEFEGLFNF